VQMRMNYEMNRQLQSDSDLSLADYHVLNALTDAPGGRRQVSDLAALIGWDGAACRVSCGGYVSAASQSGLHQSTTAGQPTRS
jgi:hypothetical protein